MALVGAYRAATAFSDRAGSISMRACSPPRGSPGPPRRWPGPAAEAPPAAAGPPPQSTAPAHRIAAIGEVQLPGQRLHHAAALHVEPGLHSAGRGVEARRGQWRNWPCWCPRTRPHCAPPDRSSASQRLSSRATAQPTAPPPMMTASYIAISPSPLKKEPCQSPPGLPDVPCA